MECKIVPYSSFYCPRSLHPHTCIFSYGLVQCFESDLFPQAQTDFPSAYNISGSRVSRKQPASLKRNTLHTLSAEYLRRLLKKKQRQFLDICEGVSYQYS